MKTRLGRFIDSFRRQEGPSPFAVHVTDPYSDHDPDHHHHDDRPTGTPTNTNRFGPPGTTVVRDHHGERYYDIRSAAHKTASTTLARELKGRHLQMIAISGSIGTGLFVASGRALSQGGPASVLLAYGIVGVMLWCTMQALGEMAVVFPVAGSFSAFSTRFLDPSWGFAMGWK
jgi:amino acid transporter